MSIAIKQSTYGCCIDPYWSWKENTSLSCDKFFTFYPNNDHEWPHREASTSHYFVNHSTAYWIASLYALKIDESSQVRKFLISVLKDISCVPILSRVYVHKYTCEKHLSSFSDISLKDNYAVSKYFQSSSSIGSWSFSSTFSSKIFKTSSLWKHRRLQQSWSACYPGN